MRVGMMLNYAGGFAETVTELGDSEKAGLQIVFVPEAYSFDAVSQLGFIAARTSTVEIASGILPIYSRTPALTAMTAAGLDFVSGGRFTLGLGASGPQVIEGWHGVPYDAPVGRTRELIENSRLVRRREPLDDKGPHYRLPLEGGTGLGKPLKLINHPVRERIPIVIAASARRTSRWPPSSPRAGSPSSTSRRRRRPRGTAHWPRAGQSGPPSSANWT